MKLKQRFTKSGIHLFDRTSGLNVLLDELECCENAVSVAPANVSVALTNRCNRSCSHCFAPKNQAELVYGALCGWIADLSANGCLGIGFGGGEPMMHPHIKDVCRYVHDNTDMACTLTTNGDFIDDSTLAWMKCTVNFIRISTNGLPLEYERLHDIANSIPTGVNYLLNAATFPKILGVAEQCATHGVQEMLLLPQMATGRCNGVDDVLLKQVDEILLTQHFPLRITVSSLCAADMKAIVPIPGDANARQYLHISADGFLKRSSLDATGVKIGARGIIEAIKEVYSYENMERL